MGVYVSTKLAPESDDQIYEFVKRCNIPSIHAKKHYHCTLAYSMKDFPYVHSTMLNGVHCRPAAWDTFGTRDDKSDAVLVLRIEAKELYQRWKEIHDAGASTDFPDYKPHVAVACIEPDFDYKALPLPDFDVIIAHEYQTELKTGSTWNPRKLIEGAFSDFREHLLIERALVRPREER